jgi:tRNA A37 threonylcarbamoyladenosine biosynthesis protein TsaE
LDIFHVDLYRLETREQITAAGLTEYFEPAGIAVVEWAERWFNEPGSLPQDFLRVRIETLGERVRRIEYERAGS